MITYMTPGHRQLVDNTLHAVANRTVELINSLNYPLGKNPPQPTIEGARQSQLGRDLEMIVQYVEGHPIDGKEADMAIHVIYQGKNPVSQKTCHAAKRF
jgi:hypothetical protein